MRPKKSLGQNFIHDDNFLKKLDKAITSDERTNIIEIGPGKGALTKYLIKKNYKKLIMIEKDANLVKHLDHLKNDKISIINEDALKFDLINLNISKKSIIVSNLPFNISSQLLVKWTKLNNWPPFYQKM